jgi:CheY-like chemotaxis protein
MSATDPAQPAAATFLLVEDNYLVGQSLKAYLEALGYGVVGPAATVAEAIGLLTRPGIIGAVLDVNIRGGTSIPVAAMLRDRRLPFFFVTGYASPPGVPPSLRHVPILHKPVDGEMLLAAIERVLAN